MLEMDILFKSCGDPSAVSRFGVVLGEEAEAAEGGRLSRLGGALSWRRDGADGLPHLTAAAFGLQVQSVLLFGVRTAPLGAGIIVDPLPARRFGDDGAVGGCCRFLWLALRLLVFRILGLLPIFAVVASG